MARNTHQQRRQGGWPGYWAPGLACLAALFWAAGCGPSRSLSTLADASPLPKASATAAVSPTSPAPTETESPGPTPTAACADSNGRLVEDSYPGRNVSGPDPILVYLPPCYAQRPGTFPVLYLLHGKPYNQSHWSDLGVVQVLEARPTGSPDWVLVMPRIPEPLFSNSDGGPGSYEDEFVGSLVPYVERHYRVRTDPGGRGIAGISRGGVWSLEIGLRHADLFGLMAALSPALAVNSPRPAYDPIRLATAVTTLPGHVFLGAGTEDWARPATERMAAVLQSRSSAADLDLVPGAHESATWKALLPAMLASADAWLGAETYP